MQFPDLLSWKEIYDADQFYIRTDDGCVLP